MQHRIRDALTTQFDRYSIERQLHAVPPHAVYEGTVDGRRAVLKVNTHERGKAAYEGAVIAAVAEHTTLPVPEVLDVGDQYFVTAWQPHAPDPDAPDPDADEPTSVDESWARAAGRGLASLHADTAPLVDGYGRMTLPADGADPVPRTPILLPFANWRTDTAPSRQQATLPANHASWHDAAVAFVHRYGDTARQHGHGAVVDRVLERLEATPDAFAGMDDPVCCHGWATPDHVTVHDDTVACMVDFEHAIAAPGEFDYSRTGLTTFDGRTDPARRAFREGYESVRELPDGYDRRRPWYRLLHLVYFFESLYVQDQHDPETTVEKARHICTGIHDVLHALP